VGRLFEIHLKDGVLVTTMYDQIPKGLSPSEVKEVFTFLSAELPEDHGLKTATPSQLFGFFFNILHKEKEVLLDPRKIQFVKEDGSPEDWSSPKNMAVLYAIDKRGDKIKRKNSPGEFQTMGETEVYTTFVLQKGEGGYRRRKTYKKKRQTHKRNYTTFSNNFVKSIKKNLSK
jgi:hypothetical protein